jgi:spore coat polysaccharide biosynthesis protein SpsF
LFLRRVKKIGYPVILATTDDPSDNDLEEVAKAEGIECFRGALKNKIRRWHDCFEKYDISHGLLVDGDDPTFDYNVGGRALETLREDGAELIISDPKLTPGFFTYGISRQGIKKLCKLVPDANTDTDVITEYVARAKLSKIYVKPEADETLGHNVRLTIDYPEDLEFYRALHGVIDYMEPSPKIVEVCLANVLQKINWHKHDDFLKNQKTFNQQVKSDLEIKDND